MEFRDALSAVLPPHRDDEPPGLREDILDELADHLICSYHRELLRGFDPAAARARALDGFGDPARLARRLWLDAMKGKIMAQRVVMATCGLLTLASLSLAGMLWMQSTRTARDLAEANRRMADTIAQNQATNHEMLNQLQSMAKAIQSPRSPGWNPVRIKVTEETRDGLPVDDVFLRLSRRGENPPRNLVRTSDISGVADFGLIEPGDYTFHARRRWPGGYQSASGQLEVRPGSDVTRSILCPKAPPDRVPVRVRCTWPADLEKEHLVLYAPFTFRHRELEPGIQWDFHERSEKERGPRRPAIGGGNRPAFSSPQACRSILSGPGASTFEIMHSRGLVIWALTDEVYVFRADVRDEDLRQVQETSEALKWEPGTYALNELIVIRPTRSKDVETGRKRFDVLARVYADGVQHGVQFRQAAPTSTELDRGYFEMAGFNDGAGMWGEFNALAPTIELPAKYWTKQASGFEIRAGQVNEWTIPLPDELIKVVREKLKNDEPAKAE
jgi:hypothetical protein